MHVKGLVRTIIQLYCALVYFSLIVAEGKKYPVLTILCFRRLKKLVVFKHGPQNRSLSSNLHCNRTTVPVPHILGFDGAEHTVGRLHRADRGTVRSHVPQKPAVTEVPVKFFLLIG